MEYEKRGAGNTTTGLFTKTCTFKVLNASTKEITDIPAMNTQYNGIFNQSSMNIRWCFASDDTICFIDAENNIKLLDLKTNESQDLPKFNLADNEIYTRIICKATENKLKTLIASTNQNRILILKNNLKDQIILNTTDPIQNLAFDDINARLFYTTRTQYGITLWSIDVNYLNPLAKKFEQNDNQQIKKSFLKHINTENKNIVIVQGEFDYDVKTICDVYTFIPSHSLNSWDQIVWSKILCFSHDGSQSAEKTDNSFRIITLYDNNMTEALTYLDTTKQDPNDISAQTKLLVTKLLNSIVNNTNTWFKRITLDKTESEIYAKNVPQCIKNILAKTYTIKLSEQEQSAQTSLRNKLLYGTAAIGTAIGATAAYKWWTGNKE